jgi:RNA polymerase sigma-70 factor
MQAQGPVMSDERQLVARAKAGDHQAVAGLVRLHQARLRALAARYVADVDDVYDLVQDTFLDAYRALGRFDESREFGPWLRTICRNRVMSHLRERATRRAHHLALVDLALMRQAGADREEPDSERLAALRQCLGSLTDSHRSLVELRYHQGLPVRDISQRLAKSEAGVGMMLMRIREALLRCVLARVGGA